MSVPLRTYGNYCAVDTSYTTSGYHFGGSFYPVAEKVGIFSMLQASSGVVVDSKTDCHWIYYKIVL